ncbi:MAG: PilW family protein [Candidatus Polarisedimenticolia bacterium]
MIEALVALGLTAVLFAALLTLHDRLAASFKASENEATLQQTTRAAFDRIVADVRLAGLNIHPDGAEGRPEEAIEGMWDAVLVVRADFDFEDPAASLSPETSLGGPSLPFRVVSTGNDEIVAYALGKASGGGETRAFVADVAGVPRDGSGETVSLTDVHVTHDDPPYTLYRFVVSANSTSVTRQPVADGIRSMSFRYQDSAGVFLPAAGGADDPAGVSLRRRVHRVEVRILGMTEDPDPSYLNPADPAGTARHHRTFVLRGSVTPRNEGLDGAIDIPPDDPNSPV